MVVVVLIFAFCGATPTNAKRKYWRTATAIYGNKGNTSGTVYWRTTSCGKAYALERSTRGNAVYLQREFQGIPQ